MTSTLPDCAVPACPPFKRSHTEDCDDQACPGCMPRPVEILDTGDGFTTELAVCRRCRVDAQRHVSELGQPITYLTGRQERRQLPSLYEAVLTPTRAADTGRRTSHSAPAGDGTTGQDDNATSDVRDRISVAMRQWTLYLASWVPPIPAPAAVTVPALTAHLLHHLASILTEPGDAAAFCAQFAALHKAATARAYPAPPRGQLLGPCPHCQTGVRGSTPVEIVACTGCGTTRSVEEWRQVIVGDLDDGAAARVESLISWLTARHERAITPHTLHQWASRGVLIGGERVYLTRQGIDGHGRRLYSVADATRIAVHLYGPPLRKD